MSTLEKFGHSLTEGFHIGSLFVIGAAVVWSAVETLAGIVARRHAGLDDILLLFIFLELGAMIGVYFRTRRLPVRFLIYVAITALTRYLTVDVKTLPVVDVLAIAVAILMLSAASYFIQLALARCTADDH
jgi:phosphate starvation-inducible membrane PsiE